MKFYFNENKLSRALCDIFSLQEGEFLYNKWVDNADNLYAQQANLTSGNIYGNFYVGQNGQTQGITIDGINGDISTSQFASGAYGWKID